MQSADPRPANPLLADRYRVLLDIGRSLAGTLTQEDLYREIYRETAEVLEAAGFYISIYDQARDVATIVFYADRGEERRADITYRGSDSEIIRTGKPSIVANRDEISSLLVVGDEEGEVTASAMTAPLRHKGRVLGAISVQSYESEAYNEADLELLQGIADIAAISVENARFVSELERRKREAEQVEEIGRALTSSLDTQEVLGKVVEAVLEVVGADGATVWLLEGTVAQVAASGGEIALPLGAGWELGGGPIHNHLVRHREPVLIDDLERSQLVPDDLREQLQAGSGIAVPMIVGDGVAGALSAGSRLPRFFNHEDVQVLERIASQASVALQNAALHQNVQALSLTDPLTGLPNRRHLQRHLDREVAAAQRGRRLVLVIFNLDDFNEYNDTLGHLAGDEILRAFGQVLADQNRAMNLVARYGGDEFMSVLSDADLEGARGYVRRVRSMVADNPVLEPHGITVSFGAASFDPSTMRTSEDLIQAADADLYERKPKKGQTR